VPPLRAPGAHLFQGGLVLGSGAFGMGLLEKVQPTVDQCVVADQRGVRGELAKQLLADHAVLVVPERLLEPFRRRREVGGRFPGHGCDRLARVAQPLGGLQRRVADSASLAE
jgi:hypothetical protein